VRHLPPPVDAMEFHPDSESILDAILDEAERNNIHTYQKRPSNRLQISSLMNLVCGLVKEIETALTKRPDTDVTVPVVLDIGAGKALFTRGVFEALNGQVAAVALDSRKPCKTDQVYDPPPGSAYTRLVADVRSMTESTLAALKGNEEGESEGGVVAMTKHLCGGATDACLTALCVPPLASYIGACCFAPCCHQKTKRTQYCNLPFLEAQGFCNTHVGVRGQVQDVDWKNFRMLVSMSKGGLNAGITEGGEYKNSQMLQVLGRDRACKMGRQARRLLEEGRMQYLQDHGFDTVLVKYCDETVTGDNWAIIARKRSVLNSVHR
jgi:tRNA:m4X modification enzyme